MFLGGCHGISGGFLGVANGLLWNGRWFDGCYWVVATVLLAFCNDAPGGCYAALGGCYCTCIMVTDVQCANLKPQRLYSFL